MASGKEIRTQDRQHQKHAKDHACDGDGCRE